ncbi:MAG TPA: sugar phosphate isomerase/epimerase family protein [Rhodothermales bacterium]|nr:sugar phosphate isomerase/epimerase family protein [Rhodothermales bacterium]
MYDSSIVCCFLYPITKYGYPPAAAGTTNFLREMKDLGFQSVELEGIHERHLGEVFEIRHEIAAALKRMELEVPYFCAVLPGLSSQDHDERRHYLGLFEKGCEIASTLGSFGILDNAPIPPYRFPEGIPVTRHYDEDVLRNASLPRDLEWGRYWEDLTLTYAEACDIAGRYGLTYQVHPCLGALSSTVDGFLLFRDAVDRDNLRFNLDTANLFALKDNPILALHRLAGELDYVHLSDNRGDRVEHLVPGDGAIDWTLFFETIGTTRFKGHIGIDVGGAESRIGDIEAAYRTSAEWLAGVWPPRE